MLFELYSLVAGRPSCPWCYAPILSFGEPPREQLCLPRWQASFPTRLRCVICAAARSARCGAGVENLSISDKKKNTVHPNGYTVFLAEMERFELSRRYSRPTPLAGAPLRPLEYISRVASNARASRRLVACRNILSNFTRFVNTFRAKTFIYV